MVSDEALKKLQEQIAAWPMTQRFVVQQLIEDYRRNREDLRAYKATGLTPQEVISEQSKHGIGGLTMDEYISRKEAIAYIREQSEECQKAFEELGGESGIYADAYNDLAEDFYSIPAADVAPVVHGRWAHLGGDEWCCSACGFVITTEGSWDKPTKKYCEDCGAKMDIKNGGDSDAAD